MTEESPNTYIVDLPAIPCTSSLAFYLGVDTTDDATVFHPLEAPVERFELLSAHATVVVLDERFETDNPAWTVINDAELIDGEWERVDPNFTLFGIPQTAHWYITVIQDVGIQITILIIVKK